jgi:nitrogen regulatory protein PII
MKNAQKIEIITEKRAISQIISIIDKHGVTGYTVIGDVTGKGKRGEQTGYDLNDVFKNTMIITICDEEQATAIVADVKVFLQRISGICVVSDVKYVLH